ncbi:MAG: hypothetical protein Q8P31_01390 [Bacillota bacterium]|nr:hypothetical protein [Bacillota bacterium]
MVDQNLMRLLHLLRALAERADGMAAGGLSTASYQAVGRMFNEYVEQLRAAAGEDLVSQVDPVDIPQDPSEAERFLGELALRASQIASEIRFALRHTDEDDIANREDWADALIRLSEAGVDTDHLVETMAFMGGPMGTVDRRFVDRLAKLAQAGVDVDHLIEQMPFVARRKGGLHHRPGFERPRHRSHTVVVEHRGGRRSMRVTPPGCDMDCAGEPSESEGKRNTAWRTEVLSRVEKGEITPEEAIGLLREGRREREEREEGEE